MTDKITLRNMQFYGYHGAFAAEKELGQRFEVDVELINDFQTVGQTDDIDLAVNYVDIYTIVKDIVEDREFNLIESIAESIAAQILSTYDLQEVVVRVRKPGAPVGAIMDSVEIEISRSS